MTALRFLALLALSTPAVAAPKIDTVLEAGGIPLPGEARGGTFCEQSRRAVVWLDSGEAIGIDRTGALTPLGFISRPMGGTNRIVCDRQDRVIAIDRDRLVILEGGRSRTVQATAPLTQLGLLADGRVAVLDRDGKVSTFDGTFTASWQTTTPLPSFGAINFSPDGSMISFIQRGVVNVVDSTGLRVGPAGLGAVWDGDSLVVSTSSKGLAKWRTTDKPDVLDVIDDQARGSTMFWAGNHLVQQLGPTATVRALGAPPVVVKLTRWPVGASTYAAGNAPFMVIAGNAAAYVVDITRDGAIVPGLKAHAQVNDMVFSPDGKQLAISGGDAVLISKLGTRAIERKEYPTSIFAPRLFWDTRGLTAVFMNQKVRWTGGAREVTSITDHNTVLDDKGQAVDASLLCKQAFAARASRGFVAARCGAKVMFGPIGKPSTFTTSASAFAIAGGSLVYADGQRLMVHGEGKTRELGKLTSFVTAIVATADGKRLAISQGDSISVWDLDRGLVMTHAAGRNARMAWSPDASRLAVAVGMAVAVWRL